MERFQKLLIVLFLFASLWPAWYANRWLQNIVQPRRSLLRLLIYLLTCFALVFSYSFLVVLIISSLFPLPKR